MKPLLEIIDTTNEPNILAMEDKIVNKANMKIKIIPRPIAKGIHKGIDLNKLTETNAIEIEEISDSEYASLNTTLRLKAKQIGVKLKINKTHNGGMIIQLKP